MPIRAVYKPGDGTESEQSWADVELKMSDLVDENGEIDQEKIDAYAKAIAGLVLENRKLAGFDDA